MAKQNAEQTARIDELTAKIDAQTAEMAKQNAEQTAKIDEIKEILTQVLMSKTFV